MLQDSSRTEGWTNSTRVVCGWGKEAHLIEYIVYNKDSKTVELGIKAYCARITNERKNNNTHTETQSINGTL